MVSDHPNGPAGFLYNPACLLILPLCSDSDLVTGSVTSVGSRHLWWHLLSCSTLLEPGLKFPGVMCKRFHPRTKSNGCGRRYLPFMICTDPSLPIFWILMWLTTTEIKYPDTNPGLCPLLHSLIYLCQAQIRVWHGVGGCWGWPGLVECAWNCGSYWWTLVSSPDSLWVPFNSLNILLQHSWYQRSHTEFFV
jgi:hypothetical protein